MVVKAGFLQGSLQKSGQLNSDKLDLADTT